MPVGRSLEQPHQAREAQRAAARQTDRPWQATAHLAATGRVFGAVTRNRTGGDAHTERIEDYGLGPWFAGATTLGLDFDAISDTRRWSEAVRDALDGCSAVDTDARHAVELADPAERVLRLPAAGVRV